MRTIRGARGFQVAMAALMLGAALAACSLSGAGGQQVRYFSSDTFYEGITVVAQVEHAVIACGLEVPVWDRAGFDPVCETSAPPKVADLREIGNRLSLDLLDGVWRGVDFLYQWRCQRCGVIHQSSAYQKRIGRGCPSCGRVRAAVARRTGGPNRAQEYAVLRGGRCLRSSPRASDHRFRCSKGHEWEVPWSSMFHLGNW
jgi:hypothetical protein